MPHVYSTLSSGMVFADYAQTSGNDLPTISKRVEIHGKANVITKHLITPKGIGTEVSPEDLDWLEKNESFKELVENGFLTVSNHQASADKVAADMTPRDASSPLTPTDYTDNGVNAPKVDATQKPAEDKARSVIDRVFKR